MNTIKEETGFSLIEVVASVVIISIALLSCIQLIIHTNKTADLNNDKLVAINLADGILEKLKATTITQDTSITNVNDYFHSEPTTMSINGRDYTISYSASQSTTQPSSSAAYTEEQLNLIKVVVTVTSPNGKTKGSSEGYVSIEQSTP